MLLTHWHPYTPECCWVIDTCIPHNAAESLTPLYPPMLLSHWHPSTPQCCWVTDTPVPPILLSHWHPSTPPCCWVTDTPVPPCCWVTDTPGPPCCWVTDTPVPRNAAESLTPQYPTMLLSHWHPNTPQCCWVTDTPIPQRVTDAPILQGMLLTEAHGLCLRQEDGHVLLLSVVACPPHRNVTLTENPS